MPSPAELRAKSKARAQEESGLSITSLMDMMTIILVFLLKSYSVEDIQVKPSADLKLPLSSSKKDPEVAVSVVVSKRTVAVDGVKVIDVNIDDLTVADEYKRGTMITPLYDVLQEKADDAKALAARNPNQPFKGRLLIQCDKDIPFSLLREVMYTAGQAQFGEFKFVVFKNEAD